MDSILTTTKKYLGLPLEAQEFDADILMNINLAFSTLKQATDIDFSSVGLIEDVTTEWDSLGLSNDVLGFVKPYVYTKTKLLFDPPENGILLENLNKHLAELIWRIEAAAVIE